MMQYFERFISATSNGNVWIVLGKNFFENSYWLTIGNISRKPVALVQRNARRYRDCSRTFIKRCKYKIGLFIFFSDIFWFIKQCITVGFKSNSMIGAYFLYMIITRNTEWGVIAITKDSVYFFIFNNFFNNIFSFAIKKIKFALLFVQLIM